MTQNAERRCARAVVRDGLVAGAVAAIGSGGPSTIESLVRGRDVLEPTLAAGSMLLPRTKRRGALLAAAAPVHLALSLGWAIVLAAILPRRMTVVWGSLAGLAIAALDLGVVGRRFARIRALPLAPQIADHLAFGAIVGAVLEHRRRRTPLSLS